MKAAKYRSYGPPEVVKVSSLPVPVPGAAEMLVRLITSTVNRTDTGFRSANYFVSRFWSGLFKPNNPVLGCEFAGVVEQIGSEVSGFKMGDRVFGFDDNGFGGHAEFKIVRPGKGVALIPDNLTFDQAAALTEGGHYALNYIHAAKLKAGDKVLVYGATGAIGSAAVQLLHEIGVHVTAVSNEKNMELVRELGAQKVISYEKEDYRKLNMTFDAILDAVGKISFGSCKHLLTESGVYMSTELGKGAQNVFLALFTPLWKGKKVLFPIPQTRQEEIEYLADLASRGKYNAVIDRAYHLDEIVEAHRYVDTGQKTGNVLIHIQNY